MAYWLLKSEPSDYSIDDLQRDGITPWDGIRNFQARNFIRDQLTIGDQVYIYHSSCKQVGIAGVGEVASAAYADPAQFNESSKYFDDKSDPDDPKWFVVDIKFSRKAVTLLPLKAMKTAPELADLVLFRQSRLSVMPLNDAQWHYINGKIC